eukprot:g71575.t1
MDTYTLASGLLWPALLALAAADCPYVWRAPVPTDLLLELVVPAGGAVWTLPAGAAAVRRRRQLAQTEAFTVYWGDNTAVQTCSSAAPCTHTFASAGVFTTIIQGPVVCWAMTPAWRDQQYSNVALRSVMQWGGLELDPASGYHFYGETQLQSLPPLSGIDTSRITSFEFSFSGLPSTCVDVSALDPRSALVLTGAFANSPCLTFANVSAWDMSQARDVSLMFAGTTVVTIVGLENWNVSRVVNATGLFVNATALQADLSNWQLDSLQDAAGMLDGAPQLKQNLSSWTVAWTQQTCLVQSAQLENWQAPVACQQWLPSVTPSVSITSTRTSSVSRSPSATPTVSASVAPVSSAVFIVSAAVGGSTAYTLPFLPDANAPGRLASTFPYTVNWGDGTAAGTCDNAAPCSHSYATAGNYTVTLTSTAIVGFTTRDSLVFTANCADRTFASGAPCWGPVRLHTTSGYHFAGSVFTSAPPPLPASSGLRSLVHWLDGLHSLGAAALDVSALDTSAVTNLTDLASGAPQLVLVGLGSWNTSAVVDATRAFKSNTGSLAGVELWNVSALEYAADMFKSAQSFDEDLSGWHPRRLRTFTGLFSQATAFRGRGLGAWPAWCYNASIFEAQVYAKRTYYKQLYVLPTTDNNPLRVNYGDGRGWISCNQVTASTAVPNICRPASNAKFAADGFYTVLIEGRLDGFLTMVARDYDYEHSIKFQAIYAWGNVSLASPPAYTRDGTLLSGWLSVAMGPLFPNLSDALTDLFYLAPTAGTRALERVTRADWLLYNAGKLVGDLSDWRVPFNGSATYAFANAKKFNQNISAWPMSGITNTSFMFAGAAEFNQPLDPWGVSSTDMQFMFDGAVKFNQPLSSWNQRGTLVTIRGMLNGAVAFNQPLGTWNMSALVTNFAPAGDASPFRGCCRFMQNLSAWPRPTTLAGCQGVASESRLTYAMLPAACRAFPPENYPWWNYIQSFAVLDNSAVFVVSAAVGGSYELYKRKLRDLDKQR